MKIATQIIVIGLLVLLMTGIGFIVYRLWFEFDNATIRALIKKESEKYSNPQGDAQIITDGVFHILESRSATKQVKDFARIKQISKEQALVSAAVAEALNYGYLKTAA